MQTQAALERHLPRVLATLAHDYLKAHSYDAFGVAKAGYGELCEDVPDLSASFAGACAGGHPELAARMAELMKDRDGRVLAEGGLCWACSEGHYKAAKVAIAYGAVDWNRALGGACAGMHEKLAKFMIRKGATWCPSCEEEPQEHRLGGLPRQWPQPSGHTNISQVGGVFQQLCNYGSQDTMIMSTATLNQRIARAMRLSDNSLKVEAAACIAKKKYAEDGQGAAREAGEAT